MRNVETIERIVWYVLGAMRLNYRIQSVFGPQNQAYVWCVGLIDDAAQEGQRAFNVCIGPLTESNLDEVKDDFRQQLAKRLSK